METTNKIESYISDIQSQLKDKESWSKHLSDSDREEIETAIAETNEWLSNNKGSESTTKEDLEEQLATIQSAISPIVNKIVGESGGKKSATDEDDDEDDDEL